MGKREIARYVSERVENAVGKREIEEENGGNVSKRVENAVGKREIARYKQFLVFPQSFRVLKRLADLL